MADGSTSEKSECSIDERLERRLAGLEYSSKTQLALILVSLSCSLVALLIVLVMLFTT